MITNKAFFIQKPLPINFFRSYFSFLFVAVVYLTGLNFVEGSILRFIEDITGYAVSAQLQAGFSNMRLYLIILFKLVDGLIVWIVHFIRINSRAVTRCFEDSCGSCFFVC